MTSRQTIQDFLDTSKNTAIEAAKEYTSADTYAFSYGYTLSIMQGALEKLNLSKKQLEILKNYK
jgi:hypothetical protein